MSRSRMQRPCLLLGILLPCLVYAAFAGTTSSQNAKFKGYTVHLVFSNHLVSGYRNPRATKPRPLKRTHWSET
jgi:hypothetical protein